MTMTARIVRPAMARSSSMDQITWLWCVYALIMFSSPLCSVQGADPFVYRGATELVSTGDFNGDGRADVVVVDRSTGNARVGYQEATGTLTWGAPVSTGVPRPGTLAVGRFTHTNREAIAVSATEFNRIHVMDLANSPSPSGPAVLSPAHAGVTMLVGLDRPYGDSSQYGFLSVGSQADHDPGITLLDLFAFLGDSLAGFQDQIQAEGFLSGGNAFHRHVGDVSLLAALRRGSNDTFVAYAYTNTASPVLSLAGLTSGTDYAFGRFHNETFSRLFFYVPGESNVTVRRLIQSAGGIDFGPATVTSFTSAVARVFIVAESADGYGVVQFGDGAVGVRPESGSDQLRVTAGYGVGATGNVITGIVPLGAERFIMLSGRSNVMISVQAQVFAKSGSNYVQTSSSTLPATTTTATRANVWLFAGEPFVSPQPGLVASLNAGDWIGSITGLPGAVSVVTETDRGVSQGLGNPTTQALGPAPSPARFALPNQHHPAISLFSYAGPRAPEPVFITITPPPGRYDSSIFISFQTGVAGDEVYYRLGSGDAYRSYAGPFALAKNSQIEYYGQNLSGQRSAVQTARFVFASDAGGIPPVVSTNTTPGATNPPTGDINTNVVQLSTSGTIFYARRSSGTDTIWAINLDGNDDRFITYGTLPRVSKDARYLAFLREGDAVGGRANIWARDLVSGAEARIFNNPDYLYAFDWDNQSPTIIFDLACQLWQIGLSGPATPLALNTDCYDDAPAVNPVDGRLAFHNASPNLAVRGLYVTPPDRGSKQRLNLPLTLPVLPSWSPEGERIVLRANSPDYPAHNLYVVHLNGTMLHQITGLKNADGFPYGAIWSPAADALIAAGQIAGVNGLWVLPLNEEGTECAGEPIRLPTTPGDPIEFAGSVVTRPPEPELFVRREAENIVIFWDARIIGYHLEGANELTSATVWTRISGPYPVVGGFFEHRPVSGSTSARRFYRLTFP